MLNRLCADRLRRDRLIVKCNQNIPTRNIPPILQHRLSFPLQENSQTMNITHLALVAIAVSPVFFALAAKAQTETEEQMKNLMSPPYDDIMKAKAMIDKYTPEGQLYLVNEAGQVWMKRALSTLRRDEWLQQTDYWSAIGGETPARKKFLFGAFDELKASAEKKLPNYLPKDKLFAFHSDEDEKLMRAAISNINDTEKIFKTGTAQNDWIISKGNNGIPIDRYKQGYIYCKFPTSITGHKWSLLIHVNIIQDYAGSGTYGPAYGKLIYTEVMGNPK
jgi:hypothetical protein